MKAGDAMIAHLLATLPDPAHELTVVFYDGEEVERRATGWAGSSTPTRTGCGAEPGHSRRADRTAPWMPARQGTLRAGGPAPGGHRAHSGPLLVGRKRTSHGRAGRGAGTG